MTSPKLKLAATAVAATVLSLGAVAAAPAQAAPSRPSTTATRSPTPAPPAASPRPVQADRGRPGRADDVDAEATTVDSPQAQQAYHDVFSGLADRQDLNAPYHCSAGKDRTGWASAVLLTALGVPQDSGMQDHLASNTYRAALNAAALASMPAAYAAIYKPLLDVRAEYLNNGFAEVQKQYGSFDVYLTKGLKLDARILKHLRAELLIG